MISAKDRQYFDRVKRMPKRLMALHFVPTICLIILFITQIHVACQFGEIAGYSFPEIIEHWYAPSQRDSYSFEMVMAIVRIERAFMAFVMILTLAPGSVVISLNRDMRVAEFLSLKKQNTNCV